MNEYLVEDEYSFYEIDPECKIGMYQEKKENGRSKKPERASAMSGVCGNKDVLKREECGNEEGCSRNLCVKRDMNKRRNSRRRCHNCSCLFLIILLLKKLE